jgi:hypothetical protein
MVVGHSKSKVIQKQPLLRWYFSFFEEVLREPNRNLVTIGYGFGDHHVNDVIADAIRDHGLKLHLISLEDPIHRRTHFMPPQRGTTASRGREIWAGLAGYYRAFATDLYRRGKRDLPPEGRALFESLGLPLL